MSSQIKIKRIQIARNVTVAGMADVVHAVLPNTNRRESAESFSSMVSQAELLNQYLNYNEAENEEQERIKKLVPHVPNCIINLDHRNDMPFVKQSLGVVLFADISGFTALTEKYSTMIASNVAMGTDKLSATLNAYIGNIVDEIIKREGDVIKFAGDAILATWKCSDIGHNARSQLNKVINCSIDIQTNCDTYETEVGIVLRVKLAIAVGSMCLTNVGLDTAKEFDISGSAIDDVGLTEKYAKPGSITLSQIAWANCDQQLYSVIPLEKQKYFQVTGHAQHGTTRQSIAIGGPQQINLLRHSERCITSNMDAEIDQIRDYTFDMPKALLLDEEDKIPGRYLAKAVVDPTKTNPSSMKQRVKKFDRITMTVKLRPEEVKNMRLYVPTPVLYKIDNGQQLDWLSEMRQVSVLFINMKLPTPTMEAAQTLQKAFEIVYEGCVKYEGNLNKVFGFDKGCTFVVIFGLPGQKHEDDPVLALQCAHHIFDSLHAVQEVSNESIGVTTGAAFCGVVGHEDRHEYTVIGSKVNMAARLMMYYPNVLTCDAETYESAKSRLRKQDFIPMPYLELKGLKDPGIVREYNPNSGKTNEKHLSWYPIIGRKQEMTTISSVLYKHKMQNQLNSDVIIIEGDIGIGKTRLVEEILNEAEKQLVRVVSVKGELAHAQTTGHVRRMILNAIMEVEDMSQESYIHSIINGDEELLNNIGFLGELLHVDMGPTQQYDEQKRDEKSRSLLRRFITAVVADQPLVIAVDNARFVDCSSWETLEYWIEEVNAVFVISIRSLALIGKLCESAENMVIHQKRNHFMLSGFADEQMVDFICQILEVEEVPKKLVKIVQTKSQGVPSWCEQIIKEMIESNHIQLITKPLAVINQKLTKFEIPIITSTAAMEKITEDNTEKNSERRTSQDIEIKSIHHLSDRPRRGSDAASMKKSTILPPQGKSRSNSLSISLGLSKDILETEVTYDGKDYAKVSEGALPCGSDDICVITPGIDLESMLVPDSMKDMVLTRMDKMTLSEQTVLKCAAVLGQTFTRDLLKAIIPKTCANMLDTVLYNLGKQKFFECGSLSLAASQQRTRSSSSFSAVQQQQLNQQQLQQHNHKGHHPSIGRWTDAVNQLHHHSGIHHTQVLCGCYAYEGYPVINISQTNAFCDQKKRICLFFQFSNTFVQEAAYALWLEDQRKSLIEKAAIHLEQQSHKCKACGGDGFVPGHGKGVSVTEHLRNGTGKKFSVSGSSSRPSRSLSRIYRNNLVTNPNVTNIYNNITEEAQQLKKRSRAEHIKNYDIVGTKGEAVGLALIKVAREYAEIKEGSKQHSKMQKFALSRKRVHPNATGLLANTILQLDFQPVPQEIAPIGVRTRKNSSIAPHIDLSQCQCNEVQALILPKLVYFCEASGNLFKKYHYTIDAAAAEIDVNRNMKALGMLKDADEMMRQQELRNYPDFHVSDEEKARVECLKGQALCNMDSLDEGINHFHASLRLLDAPQPVNKLSVILTTWKASLIQALHQNMPGVFTDYKSVGLDFSIEKVRCLAFLAKAYTMKGDHDRAYLAILEQLNVAEEFCEDYWHELVTAYTYMIASCQVYSKYYVGQYYESLVLEKAKLATVNLEDTLLIGQLHLTLTHFHIANGNINRAEQAVQRAVDIAKQVNDLNLKIHLYPMILHVKLMKLRVQGCHELLLEFKEAVRKMECQRGKWIYYYCCMDYYLDTGEIVEPLAEIVKFAVRKDGEDPISRQYLRTAIALMFARNHKWMDSGLFHQEYTETATMNENVMFYCRLQAMSCEIHLHQLRINPLLENVKNNVERSLNRLRKLSQKNGVYSSRPHVYAAYYAYLRHKDNRARLLLEDCVIASRERDILFDLEWATASKCLWWTPDVEHQWIGTIKYILPRRPRL